MSSSLPALVCDNFLGCETPAVWKCARCKGASPETVYCSKQCQERDWQFHKPYCGKEAYTFELTLLGSSNPVITRVFDVPAWFTFRQLHYTIQYAMGPWQSTHLHNFTFEVLVGESRGLLDPRYPVLSISPNAEDDCNNHVPKEAEETLLLSDVYDPAGRLRNLVIRDGAFLPLVYLYDFGDNWEHKLIFKGSKLARADRPLFTAGKGCAPVEDCSGPSGWNDVKAAFRSRNATAEQRRLITWAKDVSELGEGFNPFAEPDIKMMNNEGRWATYLTLFKRASGDNEENSDYDSDAI